MKVHRTLTTASVLRLAEEKMKAACKAFPFVMETPQYPRTAACLGSVPHMYGTRTDMCSVVQKVQPQRDR